SADLALDRDGVDARVRDDHDDLARAEVLALQDGRGLAAGPFDLGELQPGGGGGGRVEDRVDAGQAAGADVGVQAQELGVAGPEQVQDPAGGDAGGEQPGRPGQGPAA